MRVPVWSRPAHPEMTRLRLVTPSYEPGSGERKGWGRGRTLKVDCLCKKLTCMSERHSSPKQNTSWIWGVSGSWRARLQWASHLQTDQRHNSVTGLFPHHCPELTNLHTVSKFSILDPVWAFFWQVNTVKPHTLKYPLKMKFWIFYENEKDLEWLKQSEKRTLLEDIHYPVVRF